MNKAYTKIIWINGASPALNEDNLNAMSEALDEVDDRIVSLAGNILEVIPQIQAYLEQADDLVEALETLSQNPPYIGANGNWYVFNTSTEEYEDSGIDASITVQIADVTAIAPDATPYVTNTGTNTDPVFHLFIPRGQTGQEGDDGVSPEVTITSISGGHRVTITDADHPSGQSFDVMDGAGSGDMRASTYDPNGAVANAGGIKAYGDGAYKGINAHDAWGDVTSKPFDGTDADGATGSGLIIKTSGNKLAAYIYDMIRSQTSSSPSTSVATNRYIQKKYNTASGVNTVNMRISPYRMAGQLTLSTTAETTITFTNALITADILITDILTSIYGLKESNAVVNGTNHTVTLTFPAWDTAETIDVVLEFDTLYD